MRSLVMGVFAALALAACSGPKEKPTAVVIEKQENLKTKPEQAKQVDPARKVLGQFNAIEVLDIRTATVNDRMDISFEIKNKRGMRDVVQYRLRWLDANGLAVAQYDPWETIAIEGHEQKMVNLMAPTPKAVDFRIELQSNK